MKTPTSKSSAKHKLRHPATVVAVVLGLIGLLSAAAFALPATEVPAKTGDASSQAAFQRASAERARAAFERANEQDQRARRTTFLRAVSNQKRAAELRAIAADRAAEARAEAAERSQAATPAPAGNGRCGGNLPPCCVMNRESGGNIHAQNPTSTASGKWQFLNSTWNGYGGYPTAASAPESVQDAKAAELWAGGSGAGHWGGGC